MVRYGCPLPLGEIKSKGRHSEIAEEINAWCVSKEPFDREATIGNIQYAQSDPVLRLYEELYAACRIAEHLQDPR